MMKKMKTYHLDKWYTKNGKMRVIRDYTKAKTKMNAKKIFERRYKMKIGLNNIS